MWFWFVKNCGSRVWPYRLPHRICSNQMVPGTRSHAYCQGKYILEISTINVQFRMVRNFYWPNLPVLFKGQLISKGSFAFFHLHQKWTKIFLYFCPEIDSWVQYNLTMPEYKKSSTNIKFDHWKCIRISEKAHLRSDFRKKNISLSGARTHKPMNIFRA